MTVLETFAALLGGPGPGQRDITVRVDKARIQRLLDAGDIKSDAALFADALRLYEAALGEHIGGNQFFVRDETGHVRPWPVFTE